MNQLMDGPAPGQWSWFWSSSRTWRSEACTVGNQGQFFTTVTVEQQKLVRRGVSSPEGQELQ